MVSIARPPVLEGSTSLFIPNARGIFVHMINHNPTWGPQSDIKANGLSIFKQQIFIRLVASGNFVNVGMRFGGPHRVHPIACDFNRCHPTHFFFGPTRQITWIRLFAFLSIGA
jgi:hypothetical protein